MVKIDYSNPHATGEHFGYPKCCIDFFCNNKNIYSSSNKHYWGFYPCPNHRRQIDDGKVKVYQLIGNRQHPYPFPQEKAKDKIYPINNFENEHVDPFHKIDIEYAYFGERPAFAYKRYSDNEDFIKNNGAKLLAAYDNYELSLKNQTTNKHCFYCNAPLRWIGEPYNFWGCTRYQKGERHSIVNRESVAPHWLTDILKGLQLHNFIPASALLRFYLGNGLDDLRIKYGYDPTIKLLENYKNTKRISLAQESECLELIQESGRKVAYQQCIHYKLRGQAKATFCLPDFIAGNSTNVWVIDAKLSHLEDDKMNLYVRLVEHILAEKGDTRPVIGSHIVYEHNGSITSAWDILQVRDGCILDNPL